MEPGIYDIPEAEYHADCCPAASLSSSLVKLLLFKSPLHAWLAHPKLNPDWKPEEKDKFDLGTAAHALLLEGVDNVRVIEFDDWRTKDAKEGRELARADGKIPLLRHQYEAAHAMVRVAEDAIVTHPELQWWMEGESERTLVWREGDIWCRARVDRISADRKRIADYKSTADAEPGAFSRQISRMAYHIQDAFYRRGTAALFGSNSPMLFIAQDTEAPHACSFHGVAPSLAQIADGYVEQAIKLWGACLKANKFPGYSTAVHWTEATAWQMTEFEEAQNGHGIEWTLEQLYGLEQPTMAIKKTTT